MKIIKYAEYKNDNARKYRILLYGQPGTGKTTLATSMFPKLNTLIIDTEDGARYLQEKSTKNLSVVRMTEWITNIDEKKEFFKELNKYDVIVIDTVGALQEIIAKSSDILGKKRDGMLSLQGYGELKEALMRFMNALYTTQAHIIVVCHQKQQELTKRNDAVKDMITTPAIIGGALNDILGRMDIVGRVTIKTIKGLKKKDEVKRFVSLDVSNSSYITKDRPGLFVNESPDIEVQNFIKIINK